MPVTISYDLSGVSDQNDRNYIRSMFERFSWRRLGGSVLRYEGVPDQGGVLQEDWLNHVVPALMFFRSFVIAKNITVTRFTVDAMSVSHIDISDPVLPLGTPPQDGAAIGLATPTNVQSSEQKLRAFVLAGVAAAT